jgi:hypothetical protein
MQERDAEEVCEEEEGRRGTLTTPTCVPHSSHQVRTAAQRGHPAITPHCCRPFILLPTLLLQRLLQGLLHTDHVLTGVPHQLHEKRHHSCGVHDAACRRAPAATATGSRFTLAAAALLSHRAVPVLAIPLTLTLTGGACLLPATSTGSNSTVTTSYLIKCIRC